MVLILGISGILEAIVLGEIASIDNFTSEMTIWLPIVTAVTTAALSGAVLLLLQFFVLPRLEREKTTQRELWKTKKEVFLDSITLVDRVLACVPWDGAPADYLASVEDFPDTNELNKQLHQLLLLSDDIRIPQKFVHLISGISDSTDRSDFLLLLRRELSGSKLKLSAEEFPFFLPRSREQMKEVLEIISDIKATLAQIDSTNAHIDSVQVHKPNYGQTMLKITCPDEKCKEECLSLLRSYRNPERLYCVFNDSETPERL